MTQMTPGAVAALKPFYVRDATEHRDIVGRYATFEEAAAKRHELGRQGTGHIFIVKDRRK